ncbi:DUF937 domain-containing protein [Acidovorax sp. SUPP2522]|uniref:DUF937 domain-containing protein n=1 Tax=unclassified Acidovorax TaxID=2684926 RepID=UPI0023495877|nr:MULTISPECIES: DUF937 domain-containing protein [unclassified Acidovorax]WCM99296.1 DUF937 domain-containing protein [Acidovorax sp. GBBC 1281]GKT19804.1 DUF937 domain-containing protein [Acidovorax sp. SUPP2522]
MNPSTPSLSDELMAQLQGAPLQQLSSQLGTDATQTRSAVATALPLLLGALGRNAAQPQGAEALLGALQRDHQPAAGGAGGLDLGGLLGSLLGGGGAASGQGADILGHVFGSQRPQAEAGLGQATGLGANAGQLLQLLAPIVMSFLAQRVQAGGLDAGSLGRTLGHERDRAQQSGGLGGLGGGALGSLLDQDGDGQVGLSDLVKLGGGLFGGRR